MAYSQGSDLFEYVDDTIIELTNSQAELLNTFAERPQTVEIQLITLRSVSDLRQRESVRLNLPKERSVVVKRRSIYEREDSKNDIYSWSGMFENTASHIMLTVNNKGEMRGVLSLPDYLYSIISIGEGLHALIEIDPLQFPESLPPLTEEDLRRGKWQFGSNNQSLVTGDKVTGKSRTNQLRIMVVYTQSADNQDNMSTLISNLASNLNDSFSNSNISVSAQVINGGKVDYSESGNLQTDVVNLINGTDPDLAAVYSKRNFYEADLVSLIVGSGDRCGAGYQKADVSTAFSSVRVDCALEDLSFAHEIGHNVGAHHNRGAGGGMENFDFCDENDPLDKCYGHGYDLDEVSESTIMAGGYHSRINYWSNPLVNYGEGPIQKSVTNIPMGTFDYEHNARVWHERVSIVSSFMPIPEFTVQIFGEYFFGEGNPGEWTVGAGGGDSPYSFTWYRSYNSSSGPWSQVGTGSTYSQTVNQEKWLKLSGSDSSSETDEDILKIEVQSCGSPPCPMPKEGTSEEPSSLLPESFALEQNYPNPFNPSTTLSFDLPERSDVQIEVYNMIGRKVSVLVDQELQAGSHMATFDATGLTSGIYFARFQAVGINGQSITKTMGMHLVK